MADATALGAVAERRAGSSPVLGTKLVFKNLNGGGAGRGVYSPIQSGSIETVGFKNLSYYRFV